MISAILQSMRPKQWPKNFFVFAGLLFTLDKHHSQSDYARVGLAFVLFCVLSGVVYLVNDSLDAERDRKHPVKCRRPIASGRLSERAAWMAAGLLLAGGLAGSFALQVSFGMIALAYTALIIAYSLHLKNIVILDVMVIATGFVLRAVAGAEVIQVWISPWLLMCTILLSLFLALAKRRGELVRLEGNVEGHRVSLEEYSVPFLDQLLNITASATIIAYSLYTFSSETGGRHQYMVATLPFVLYGVFRYLMLVHKGDGAESPEILLMADKPLLLNIALWAVACAIVVAIK